jgi:hypothetical protein
MANIPTQLAVLRAPEVVRHWKAIIFQHISVYWKLHTSELDA